MKIAIDAFGFLGNLERVPPTAIVGRVTELLSKPPSTTISHKHAYIISMIFGRAEQEMQKRGILHLRKLVAYFCSACWTVLLGS